MYGFNYTDNFGDPILRGISRPKQADFKGDEVALVSPHTALFVPKVSMNPQTSLMMISYMVCVDTCIQSTKGP
jgi:hypothetical protein